MNNKSYKNRSAIFVFVFTFTILNCLILSPKVAAGEGEPEPTAITTCAGLQDINIDLTASYVLTSNIDCSATSGWNAGAGFVPIGTSGANFTGSFNGNNYVISNLYINRSGTNYVGLFSWVGGAGSVSNVTLVDADIIGENYTGVIVSTLVGSATNLNTSGGSVSGTNYSGGVLGYNNGGTLTHSHSNATVSSTNYAGGLVGVNEGTVSDSYSFSSAESTNYPGGVVGYNNGGTVENTFGAGALTGADAGGVVGYNFGTVTNSFYNSETTGATDTGKGTAKTTAELKTQSTFTGWDFTVAGNGTIGDWIMAGYPHLQNEHRSTITTAVELQLMAIDLDDDYTIANNLDATEITNYAPVGTLDVPFTGTLNGGGFLIDNLDIDQSSLQSAGIFGSTSADVTIQNVGFHSGSVIGNRFVGGIVGYNRGSITSSFSKVDVTATTITASFAEAGGLVGANSDLDAILNDNYATGSVTSTFDVGGLVGYSSGPSGRNYSTGAVSGGVNMGGLIGRAETSNVTNSFATGSIGSGADNSGGLIGYKSEGITVVTSYWNLDEGIEDCYGSGFGAGNTGCTFVDNNLSYFYDVENPPMSSWDFEAMWLAAPSNMPTLLVFGDITAPQIVNIDSDKEDNTYTVGETINVDLTFSENVTSTGNVTVTLETGDIDRSCTFTITNSNSGGCNYIVQSGDNSVDLNVASVSGTIADANGNPMINFEPRVNFFTNKAIVIDTAVPTTTISSSTITSGASSTSSSHAFTVTFNEAVTGFSSSKISLSRATLSNFATVTEGREYSFNVLPTSTGLVTVNVNVEGIEDIVELPAQEAVQFSFTKLFNNGSGGSGGSGGSSGGSSSSVSNSQTTSNTLTKNTFTDISGHFAEAAIISLFQMDVISGKTSTTFEPDSFLTRAEMAKIALLTFHYPLDADMQVLNQYNDVAESDWFAPFVATGTANGLFKGFDDGGFKPNSNATRAEFLKVMLLAAKHSSGGAADTPFVDVLVTDWFKDLVNYAYEKGIIKGKTQTIFGPNDFITRGEMAVIAIRLYQLQ